MLPRLGEKFAISIEVISKPRHEYLLAAYAKTGLSKAPAIMIGGETIVYGQDIDEQVIEAIILKHQAKGISRELATGES